MFCLNRVIHQQVKVEAGPAIGHCSLRCPSHPAVNIIIYLQTEITTPVGGGISRKVSWNDIQLKDLLKVYIAKWWSTNMAGKHQTYFDHWFEVMFLFWHGVSSLPRLPKGETLWFDPPALNGKGILPQLSLEGKRQKAPRMLWRKTTVKSHKI